MSMGGATTTSTRLRLTIAYDGRPFEGWQSQPSGETIQDYLSAASARICGTALHFQGSGRTDAGVHASGQVAHVDVPPSGTMGPAQWQAALNAHLPETIRIMASVVAPEGFHAQYSTVTKTYRYRIAHRPVLPPQLAGRSWHIWGDLDADLLREAASALTGTHDFRRFSASRGTDRDGRNQDPADTTRTVHSIEISGSPEIDLRFTGDGFLYKMVRMLTAAIVRCAQGRMSLQEVGDHLAGPDGPRLQHCAPAAGLSLECVEYP